MVNGRWGTKGSAGIGWRRRGCGKTNGRAWLARIGAPTAGFLIGMVICSAACARDTKPPVVTIVTPTDGLTTSSSRLLVTGTILDNSGVVSASLSVNGSSASPIMVGSGGAFQAWAALMPGANTISISAKDKARNTGTATRSVTCAGGPRALGITTPRMGSQVGAGCVDVRGTRSDAVALVFVQGKEALLTPGGFRAACVPLAPGINEIRILGCEESGASYEDAVTVTSTARQDPIVLSADPPDGSPPLPVTLSVTAAVAASGARCVIDYEGSGEFVALPAGASSSGHTYTDARMYHPEVRITTSDGLEFSDVIDLPVHRNARLVTTIGVIDPVDLALDRSGRLLVVERSAGRVRVFNADGSPAGGIGSPGAGPGQFDQPSGIAVDLQGRIYVADRGNHRIQIFNADRTFLRSWGTPGSKKGQLTSPTDVAVDGTGSVYVLEGPGRRIQRFTDDGFYETDWEVASAGEPVSIAYLDGEFIAVADPSGGRVLKYSTHGSAYAWSGAMPAIAGPSGLSVGGAERMLVVAEGGADRVTLLSQDGWLMRRIGAIEGDGLGISRPTAAVLDNSPVEGNIWIADNGQGRVVKAVLQSDGASSPALVWNEMRKRLREGDTEGALLMFAEESRDEYRDIFASLGDRLGAVAQEIGDVSPIRSSEDEALWGVVRMIEGEPILFDVEFQRDAGGGWKIVQF